MTTAVTQASFLREDARAAQWVVSPAQAEYPYAERCMEQRAGEIAAGRAGELFWLLEHPALYTAGVSAKNDDLLDPDRLPVFRTGRGGQFTYHGPGQRVIYTLLDLRARRRDTRAFVLGLETAIIAALSRFGVTGETRCDRVGVWVRDGERDLKIAAIGVKIRRWVSFHGASLNICPNLADFKGIIPCGIAEHGVTSLESLGVQATMSEVDDALYEAFQAVFGPCEKAPFSDPA
jgi:lipoyl(octanoyl) transferase